MKKTHCLNCESPLGSEDKYCNQCGQSIKETRLSARILIQDFFTNLFNIDGKIVHTLRDMWIPGYLTKQYIAGKRKSYFNPARFFIIMLLAHFIIISYTLSHSELNLNSDEFSKELKKSELSYSYGLLALKFIPQADKDQVDSLGHHVFGEANADSIPLFKNVRVFGLDKYGILKKDAWTMNHDTLFKKYKVSDPWHQHAIRQVVRIDKNREGSVSYIVGNMTWAIILVVFGISFISWFIYLRNRYYYVEHAALQLYFHAKAFFVFNIVTIVLMLTNSEWFSHPAYATTQFAVLFYLLLSYKMYFKQGWIKTIIKFIFICVSYVVLLAFMGLLIFLIGAIIY